MPVNDSYFKGPSTMGLELYLERMRKRKESVIELNNIDTDTNFHARIHLGLYKSLS